MGYQTLAAVDLGSNSFKLQVARVQGEQLYLLDGLKETVRLAAGLDSARMIAGLLEPTAGRPLAFASARRAAAVTARDIPRHWEQPLLEALRADIDELEDLLVRYRPKLIYTNPTFQNPTGIDGIGRVSTSSPCSPMRGRPSGEKAGKRSCPGWGVKGRLSSSVR